MHRQVILMLVSFVLTWLFLIQIFQDLGKPILLLEFRQVPVIMLALALVASSFFLLRGAFYQAYLVQEKDGDQKEPNQDLRNGEGITGIVIVGVITRPLLFGRCISFISKGYSGE